MQRHASSINAAPRRSGRLAALVFGVLVAIGGGGVAQDSSLPRLVYPQILQQGNPSGQRTFDLDFQPAAFAEPATFVDQPAFSEQPAFTRQEVVPAAGCAECEAGGLGPVVGGGPEFCAPCGCGQCVPGQKPCSPCTAKTRLGRFACGLYEALCCPDPCYEPRWLAVADAAFTCEAARPVTQQRFRWDAGVDLIFPDRAEYFWAKTGGRGPSPQPPLLGVPRVDYNELTQYTEAATGAFSFFTEVPYRSVDPEAAPHGAGFGAVNLGTKTLLFDCELMQISFQFRTFLPGGNARKGTSNGHLALEPSLLMGVKLAPETYFQGQLCEWIPLGGDQDFSGAILHYHVAVNHVLGRPLPDVPVIGTAELNGWSFQDGQFTDPELGPLPASGETYLSAGGGLRLVVCDKIDFGVGATFALTSDHWAEQLYRSEFRVRF